MIHFYREIQEWADCCLNVTREQFQKKEISLSPGGKRKDLYSEILFVFKSYQADKISLFILGKSVRRGKISPAVVSDPGVDAVVPGFKTGG